MVYKRATKILQEAGIEHISIQKYLYGPTPIDIRASEQTSRCFNSWKEAADAVLDGYRPKVIKWRNENSLEVNDG